MFQQFKNKVFALFVTPLKSERNNPGVAALKVMSLAAACSLLLGGSMRLRYSDYEIAFTYFGYATLFMLASAAIGRMKSANLAAFTLSTVLLGFTAHYSSVTGGLSLMWIAMTPPVFYVVFAASSFRVALLLLCASVGVMSYLYWISWGNGPPRIFFSKAQQLHDGFEFFFLFVRVFAIISLLGFAAMQILRKVNESLREELINSHDREILASNQLRKALAEKNHELAMHFRVQEVSGVSAVYYEPATNLIYTPVKSANLPESFSYQPQILEDYIEKFTERFGHTPKISEYIQKALENKSSWDEVVDYKEIKNKDKVFRSIGHLVMDSNNEIEVIVAVAVDITETTRLNERLQLQAETDTVTGLYNRVALERKIAEAQQSNNSDKHSALLYMDLDRFKLVNDTSGHQAGDALLKLIGDLIKDHIRPTDFVARIGGDEFVIYLQNCNADRAQEIAERVRVAIDELRFFWHGDTHQVAASIGCLMLNSSMGNSDDILNLADMACYRAKHGGRNRVEFDEGNRENLQIERDNKRWVQRINDAIQHDKFVLYVQQIESTHRKALQDNAQPNTFGANPLNQKKYEVLIRLRGRDDELIAPGAFLPIAERYNLAGEIDKWVVNHVIKKFERELAQEQSNLCFWINLSGDSVGDERFADYLVNLIERVRPKKGSINFEITETSAIKNLDAATAMMARLSALGCGFAIDDFGSGHASFGYLRKLPVDVVKIDGMFIKNLSDDIVDRIFTQSIIDVAKSTGVKTVAEFVEDGRTLELLTEMGIDYVQGYGVSEPFPMLALFDENNEDVIKVQAG